MVKNLPANAGDAGLIPGWGRFPWRRNWQPTPVFLPGKSHGQSLVGYSPWGFKELVTVKAVKHNKIGESEDSDFIRDGELNMIQL